MNMFSKLAVLLLALSILVIPAMAAEDEDHLIIVRVDPDNPNVVSMTQVPVPGHEEIPEHAELRPFFRDSDPEFAVIDVDMISYPVENAIMSCETGSMMPAAIVTTGEEGGVYEYAAIP
ncbi:MAG: hypothetical protein O0V67_10060 [Methanocorpusculum sp.]|nr:hypothetical protein [Methanocorpusculum sp.]